MVAEGVGVAVAAAPELVGVGVPGVRDPVGVNVRVRLGVAVPRVGVIVGEVDVEGPRQIPATVHAGGVVLGFWQQSLSLTHERL